MGANPDRGDRAAVRMLKEDSLDAAGLAHLGAARALANGNLMMLVLGRGLWAVCPSSRLPATLSFKCSRCGHTSTTPRSKSLDECMGDLALSEVHQ